MWSPGRVVDRYLLEAPLSEEGDFWRVRHQSLGSLHLLRVATPELLRPIAQIQAKLLHPQLLRATDSFEVDGRFCLVTDFVDRTTLADRLKQGSFNSAETSRLIKGLAGAVGALHAQGYLHLDLQPSRILWCGGIPKVADFRLTRLAGDPPVKGGNPSYLAPELLSGGFVDARADVFALGCIAYEILKGAPLFEGGSDPRRNSLPLSDLPPSWMTVLGRCLRPEASGRYPHAGALQRALDDGGAETKKDEPTMPVKTVERVRTEPPRPEPAEAPRPEPARPEPPRPPERRPPTVVTVEEEPPRAPRSSPKPEVTTRWGAVFGLLTMAGMAMVACSSLLGAGWWALRETPPAPTPAVPVAAKADTGTPPVIEAPPPPPKPAAKTSAKPIPVDAPPPAPETPAAPPPTPEAAPTGEGAPVGTGRSVVTFTGDAQPRTVEVTCRGGFRMRERVANGRVEVTGMPTDIECMMFLKDVVSTPAAIQAGRNYSCQVIGTTTKCR